MFKSQFVACLKVGGQILRESEDSVRLPFGSEYTLFLRNYDSRRAVVKVEIDGQDALGGRSLVVNGNSLIELERFIKDGDLSKGNRFRFIHKDEKIQQHRGDRVDDGIVRISWQYEQPAPTITWSFGSTISSGGTGTWHGVHQTGTHSLKSSSSGATAGSRTATDHFGDACSDSIPCNAPVTEQSLSVAAPIVRAAVPQADEGITVAGSHSTQTFAQTYVGTMEPEVHVITLKLLGESPLTGQVVEKPVTVREKLECEICGTKSDSKHRFCGYCGTCLGD